VSDRGTLNHTKWECKYLSWSSDSFQPFRVVGSASRPTQMGHINSLDQDRGATAVTAVCRSAPLTPRGSGNGPFASQEHGL
jgi:hypothetical protein